MAYQHNNTIVCKTEDLGTIVAELVKNGIVFKSSPQHDKEGYYIIEVTGGF